MYTEMSLSEAALLAIHLTASQHPEVQYLAQLLYLLIYHKPDGRDHTPKLTVIKELPVDDPLMGTHPVLAMDVPTIGLTLTATGYWPFILKAMGNCNGTTNGTQCGDRFPRNGKPKHLFFEPMKDNGSADPIMPKETMGT